ncbi:MAG: hypothetical protein LIO51_00240 [Clostridiales bacterium]|nr:hypothetical protein [Clostridiales bacterium]
MRGKRALLTALAAACTGAVLFLFSQLPSLAFPYQDAMAQTQTVLADVAGLSLTQSQSFSLDTYLSRVYCIRDGYTSNYSMDESEMGLTSEDVIAISQEILDRLQTALGLYPWQLDDCEPEVSCHLFVDETGETAFQCWDVVFFGELSGEPMFCSLLVDDETGLPLTVYCDGGAELTEVMGYTDSGNANGEALETLTSVLAESYLEILREHEELSDALDEGDIGYSGGDNGTMSAYLFLPADALSSTGEQTEYVNGQVIAYGDDATGTEEAYLLVRLSPECWTINIR